MNNKLLFIVLMLCCPISFAGELVHSFVNPNFGGSPFNGAPLLANATAQNNFEGKQTSNITPYTPKTPQQSFKENLDRQILNKLSQIIINQAFGGGATQTLPDGTSTIGNYTVTNDTFNNSITVTDSLTGEVLVTLDLNSLPSP